jgi:hypothetical protein
MVSPAGQEERRKIMQMFTTQLPDAKLLVLAKIALGPGGVIGVWGNALEAAGIDREAVAWLGENGYVESERRPAAAATCCTGRSPTRACGTCACGSSADLETAGESVWTTARRQGILVPGQAEGTRKMPKYIAKANVVQEGGVVGRVSVPVEATSAGAARNKLRADLDRQVGAGTLISYGPISVRHNKQ